MKAIGYLDSFKNKDEILKYNKDLYKTIKEHKFKSERPVLEQIQTGIFDRYSMYLDSNCDLNSISPIDCFKDYEDIMRKSYSNSLFFKTARRRIFDSLPNGRKTICPYCLVSDSSTLDHYYPETFYAEFIIFIPNLIPCCSKCNELKSTSLRETFHFYLDDIPQDTFLNITINIDSDTPIINITLDPNAPLLLKKHLKKLNLIDRYKEKASDELTQIIEMLRETYTDDNYDDIMDMLRYKIKSLKKIYGSNYWKACLIEAVLKSRNEILQVIAHESIKKTL